MSSGHYTAYCRSHHDDSCWRLYDDDEVRTISLQKVLSELEVHILFYAEKRWACTQHTDWGNNSVLSKKTPRKQKCAQYIDSEKTTVYSAYNLWGNTKRMIINSFSILRSLMLWRVHKQSGLIYCEKSKLMVLVLIFYFIFLI